MPVMKRLGINFFLSWDGIQLFVLPPIFVTSMSIIVVSRNGCTATDTVSMLPRIVFSA